MQFSISKRVGLGFIIMLLITVMLGSNSLLKMKALLFQMNKIAQVEKSKSMACYEMEINITEIALAVRSYLHGHKPNFLEKIRDSEADFRHALEGYKRAMAGEEEIYYASLVSLKEKLYHDAVWKLVETENRKRSISPTIIENFIKMDEIIDDDIQNFITQDNSQQYQKMTAAMEMEININGIGKYLVKNLLSLKSTFINDINNDMEDFNQFYKQYETLPLSNTETKSLLILREIFDTNLKMIHEVQYLYQQEQNLLKVLFDLTQEFDSLFDDKIQAKTQNDINESIEKSKQLAKQATLVIFILVVSSLVIVILFWKLASVYLINPLIRLSNAVKKNTLGEYSVILNTHTKDEIGDLNDSFNTMVIERNKAWEELEQSRDELQYKVQEKTESLVKNNEQLQLEVNQRKKAETERQKIEQQLYQIQKMEAIGQLAGGVAHDFNNMLQAIFGYTQLAQKGLSKNDKRFHYLEEVRKAAERSAALTQQLLAFSRRYPMKKDYLDLNKLFKDLLKMILRLIGENIKTDFISGQDLATVHVDPNQIEQVLLNLCVNARDSMPLGGKLCIETENHVVTRDLVEMHPWMKEGHYVLLTVTDNGCGMDKKLLEHVFEPFFTTKELGNGTGMGLATVYGIVKSHNGFIHVYSEVDKGTSFKVYFPSVEKQAVEFRKESTQGPVIGGNETILLAEDEELVRNLAVEALERAGYTVFATMDGLEAVNTFEYRADEISLVILDVIMPNLSGEEAYKRIRKIKPGIPVLFSSGYSPNGFQTEFAQNTDVELIQKPYAPDMLLRKVREIL